MRVNFLVLSENIPNFILDYSRVVCDVCVMSIDKVDLHSTLDSLEGLRLLFIDKVALDTLNIENLRCQYPKGSLGLIVYSNEFDLEEMNTLLKDNIDDCLVLTDPYLSIRITKLIQDFTFFSLSYEKSNFDYLTNLLNRRKFMEQAANEISFAKCEEGTVCCALVDIDYFKKINDTYGHLCGDEVIKGIASILRTHFRKNDLVGRFGGEEFIVLLRNTSKQKAKELLESLRQKIESTIINFDGLEISVTVSIGYICDLEYDLTTLQSRADSKLYEAKKAGRNKIL